LDVGRATSQIGRQINDPLDVEIIRTYCQGIEAERKSMRLFQEAAFNGSGKVWGRYTDRIEAPTL
jgi:hypothetical protein